MIPKNIMREHILIAIEEIDRKGIPEGRRLKKYQLIYKGKKYPPKYVISQANRIANGQELDHSLFSGGTETNNFLRDLEFQIEKLDISDEPDFKIPSRRMAGRANQDSSHNERCPKCKENILRLLESLYGAATRNFKFDAGVFPDDYRDTSYHDKLREIFEAIQNFRGNREFIKTDVLPHCDYYVQKPSFILEFDESQHFTVPRKISLSLYPQDIGFGFDVNKWMCLCDEMKNKDNDPPYRDEQRAWYDTLRDFLPIIRGFNPTVRLNAGKYPWCSLDPNKQSDVQKFKALLKEEEYKVDKVIADHEENPFFARIIIAEEWDGQLRKARNILADVYRKWPKHRKAKILITCGGFIQYKWPNSISKRDIGNNVMPNEKSVEALVEEAKKYVDWVLDDGLADKLKEVTDYLTLGIDTFKQKVSTTNNYIGKHHIELVFLIDLKSKKIYWTGKSYPTPSQKRGLVRIADLEKHFIELDDLGRVLVLGCHDLTIFNPRSKNAKGWRKKLNSEFRKICQEKEPRIVLHHPHTTGCVRTWSAAWNGLSNELPSVEKYAGAGRYFRSLEKQLDKEDKLLQSTKLGSSIDFIVRANQD